MDLVIPVLGGRFRLVQALQGTIVALVQAIVADHRDPHLVHVVQNAPQGAHGTLEHRGVSHIELKAGFLQQLACGAGFLAALFGQIHVFPAGEAVFLVPYALAVADQYQFRAH